VCRGRQLSVAGDSWDTRPGSSRLWPAQTDPNGSIDDSDTKDQSSPEHCADRQREYQSPATNYPDELQDAGESALLGQLRVRSHISDQVVEQDPERREANRPPQVRQQDQDTNQSRYGDFGMMRHPVTFMNRGKPVRKIIVARHCQRGSAYASDQRQQST
jgi:hypothetical protein